MNRSVERGPGANGPCPRCGVEMAEGHYWHMRDVHGVLKHYTQEVLGLGVEKVGGIRFDRHSTLCGIYATGHSHCTCGASK